jgi:hydrogenase maturation protein HypF
MTSGLLEKNGFQVLRHRHLPPNDGGISLGQAVLAAMKYRKEL